jgi:hypothetical protein
MIVRTWKCQALAAQAEAYHAYLIGTVFASLQPIQGHRGAYLLKREVGDRIEFEVISFWDTTEAIKEYAGEEIGRAMVKPEARAMLVQFDEFVYHYTLAHDTVGGLTDE